jgi:hypothetical protein
MTWGQNATDDMVSDPERYFREARARAREQARLEVASKMKRTRGRSIRSRARAYFSKDP